MKDVLWFLFAWVMPTGSTLYTYHRTGKVCDAIGVWFFVTIGVLLVASACYK
ncbi:hypothetical protein [Paraburkholderia rhynchosiae]|uniref:Uncharacterized protein n=1 Tax=Paraburkholderia rhynchosiae TaxID=487049 RepID=A0A6J5CAG7_9BURK|nr:hypothetical protein [Paraburkholderia rhynchosiae]CAB3730781.1 hypothetical protein LMG27174_05778 [Paraburkholderia rhynchosiae]